jgi:hypothetical protein
VLYDGCSVALTSTLPATLTGGSVQQIIPLAYFHGLMPEVDSAWLSGELSLDQAADP